MKVTVIDRVAMGKAWGTPHYGIITKEIEISDKCPVCDGPRGEPEPHYTYENDCIAWPHVWTNPCGHLDKYSDLLKLPH